MAIEVGFSNLKVEDVREMLQLLRGRAGRIESVILRECVTHTDRADEEEEMPSIKAYVAKSWVDQIEMESFTYLSPLNDTTELDALVWDMFGCHRLRINHGELNWEVERMRGGLREQIRQLNLSFGMGDWWRRQGRPCKQSPFRWTKPDNETDVDALKMFKNMEEIWVELQQNGRSGEQWIPFETGDLDELLWSLPKRTKSVNLQWTMHNAGAYLATIEHALIGNDPETRHVTVWIGMENRDERLISVCPRGVSNCQTLLIRDYTANQQDAEKTIPHRQVLQVGRTSGGHGSRHVTQAREWHVPPSRHVPIPSVEMRTDNKTQIV